MLNPEISGLQFFHGMAEAQYPEASYIIVPKNLPISRLLDSVTRRDPDFQRQLMAKATREYSDPHKRWEAVRHDRASLVTGRTITEENTGSVLFYTGWEGYFVGSGMSPEDIVNAQASIGTKVSNSMEIMYPVSYSTIKHIFDTGRDYSMEALREIEIYFKSIKARFGALNLPPEAEFFRRQTSEIVKRMPPIEMQKGQDSVMQLLPLPNGNGERAVPSTSVRLSLRELRGYRFMEKVGIVGQPLIRAMLEVH